MAQQAPPTKTTARDIEVVAEFLKGQLGWTTLDTLRKRLPTKHTGSRKIEAMRYLGLLERDGENVKLTVAGRAFADGSDQERATVMAARLNATPLYHETIQWLHYTFTRDDASKTDVGNYWHDKLPDESGGVTGDSLGDAVVFFLRMADVAGLGQFVAAGVGRDTHLRIDREALAPLATGSGATAPPPAHGDGEQKAEEQKPLPRVPEPQLTLGTGLQVNVEIHIAADAKPATIEEIFKNMRKYLLSEQERREWQLTSSTLELIACSKD
jgi:hypothetical protein